VNCLDPNDSVFFIGITAARITKVLCLFKPQPGENGESAFTPSLWTSSSVSNTGRLNQRNLCCASRLPGLQLPGCFLNIMRHKATFVMQRESSLFFEPMPSPLWPGHSSTITVYWRDLRIKRLLNNVHLCLYGDVLETGLDLRSVFHPLESRDPGLMDWTKLFGSSLKACLAAEGETSLAQPATVGPVCSPKKSMNGYLSQVRVSAPVTVFDRDITSVQ
jgi:hypothetical protein